MSLVSFIRLRRLAAGFAAALAVLLSASASSAQSATAPPPAPRRVNIIVILADHLATGDLGCYGASGANTPNLDRLAAGGARFTCFYNGSPADAPARASLLTGNDTGHLPIRGDSAGASLSDDDFIIPQYLKLVGYRTGMIGKWALGTHGSPGAPQNKGFDEFAGFLTGDEAENDYPKSIWRYVTNPVSGTFDGRLQLSQNDGGKQELSAADLFTTTAMNFVHEYKPQKLLHWHAFFLLLAYPVPHAGEAGHAAAVTSLDANIGQLMNQLTGQKVEKNTVVVFASTESSPPQISIACDLSEAALRAPLIVWYPPKVRPMVVNEPWAAWDLFPTLAELARMDAPTNVHGISFKPVLFGGSQTNRHDSFYWEVRGDAVQQAVRLDNWKGIRPHSGAPIQLFDLGADPGEKNDVAAQHPDVVARVEASFLAARPSSK